MARPKKEGLDYFPLDTDFFFRDQKIRALRRRYGNDGVAVYLYLLCSIYRNGYYLIVTDDLEEDISEDLKVPINKTRQILAYLTGGSADAERENRSLFRIIVQENTAGTVKAMTSISIQKRYAAAVKSDKRSAKNREFWILGDQQIPEAQLSDTQKGKKAEKTADFSGGNSTNKRKQNETKENKTRGKETRQDETTQDEIASDEKLVSDALTIVTTYGYRTSMSELMNLIRYSDKLGVKDRVLEAITLAAESKADNLSAYSIALMKTWKDEW